MSKAYEGSDEVDEFKPNRRGIKRPPVAMVAGAVFAILSVAILTSGAILEGTGVLIVGIGCACIGIDPTRRERRSGR
ncbi:tripartite tricarboxylate transporter permease [Neorhodopirellula pilleata]|uniref:Uncharacterized protein n=1 Tax=Neorhodopirellula pilleata TaxID=2714738 RepID=A0A5C6A0C2_9BACT|nr:tripartite tricarboxylate transporter permease [Neorhodopirellula pilleata]TWT92638.1 hypothetical protein Pla100_46580 [Neorhodopirellula pilleata]